jgi:hypothetical protein
MAAQDNLSQELFFQVHRGIVAEGSKSVDQKRNVGMHWSAERAIAEDFAIDNNQPGVTKPYVLHAEVPISSVETDPHTLDAKDVGGIFGGEKEVPVGRGQKIRITGRTTLRKDPNLNDGKNRHRYPKSRTRTYNPPREATA